jgi:hypothetical protein
MTRRTPALVTLAFLAGVIVGSKLDKPAQRRVVAPAIADSAIRPPRVVEAKTASSPTRSRTADSPPAISQASRDSMMSRRDQLSRNFDFSADEIRGGGWYSHKRQSTDNSWNRVYLSAPLNAEGRVYLSAHYYGETWIFFNRVEARIGSRIFETDRVEPDRHNSTAVWETLHFTGGQDNGLLAAIAASSMETRVIVRFPGSDGIREFDLSDRDRIAIKESFELARLLRQVGRRTLTVADSQQTVVETSTIFVADPAVGQYYLPTCGVAKLIPTGIRREFRGSRAAEAAGFTRSPIPGC